MTTTEFPALAQVLVGGVYWETVLPAYPGRCEVTGWCEGRCAPPGPDTLQVFHGRTIGSAVRDTLESDLLVEVVVGQSKAVPGRNWVDGGSAGGWPNRDRPPKVGILTYPPDGSTQSVWLEEPWGKPLAVALRAVGHVQFADFLDAAITYAENLNKEMLG